MQITLSMKTKEEFQQHLIEKAMKDPDFRMKLLENPKAVIEEEIGVKIPGSVDIKVLEEDPKTVYLILPCTQAQSEETVLTETDLEMIGGGWGGGWDPTYTFIGCPCR